MKVLGLDTATDICGVAVVESSSASGGLGGERLLCDYQLAAGPSHAEHLLVLVDRALKDLKLSLADLDGLALTIGPGSFTGLRAAVSTVKGLVTAVHKPVAAISTLEALAWTVPLARDPVCPMLDAKKKEVYAALFVFSESGEQKRLMEDQVITPGMLLKRLSASGGGPTLFVGDGAFRYRDLIVDQLGRRARFVPVAHRGSIASAVAQLGLDRLKRGQRVEMDDLAPAYLRRPDAELNLEKQRAARENKKP